MKTTALLPLLWVALALLGGSCGGDRSDSPPRAPYRPPSPSAASGEGLGRETDVTEQETFGTWKVTEDTYLCINQHAILTFLRDRTPEEEAEFQRLIEVGKHVLPLPAGTLVRRLGSRTYRLQDGREEKTVRVELVDDPDIHGSVRAHLLSPVR